MRVPTTTHIEFYDDTTNMLRHLQTVNLGLAKEGLSKGAYHLAQAYRSEFEAIDDTNWNSRKSNFSGSGSKPRFGKTLLTDKKKNFGDVHFYQTGEAKMAKGGVMNLKNYIKFYTPDDIKKLYAVVMGGHGGSKPIRWRNGFPDGKEGYVSGVGQSTLDIFRKIDGGDKRKMSKKEKSFFQASFKHHKADRDVHFIEYKARNFVAPAIAKGKGRALSSIKKVYEANLPKAVNEINRRYKAEVVTFGKKAS